MANYINNKKFQEEMLKYYNEKQNSPNPDEVRANDYIGQCILHIANKYASKWRFFNYTNSWKEEMIDDAIQNCIMYGLRSYNPVKYSNPLAYFTQIVHNSFFRRIRLEKAEQYKKLKGFQDVDLILKLSTNAYRNTDENIVADQLIKDFEDQLKSEKSKKIVKKGVEQFIDDE